MLSGAHCAVWQKSADEGSKALSEGHVVFPLYT